MQIFDVLRSNENSWYSAMDLVKIIYTETPKNLWNAAAHNVGQHLKKLEKEKKILSTEQKLPDGQVDLKWKYATS